MEEGTQTGAALAQKAQQKAEAEIEALDSIGPRPQEIQQKVPGVSGPIEQTGVNHLAMNVVIPGLGSLVRGQTGMGAAQLGLTLLAIGVLFTGHVLAGLLMWLGAWIWSLVSGIGFLKEKKLEWR
jgi:hypothetical protein